MLSKAYTNYIYHIVGEALEPSPKVIFDPTEVYLIIDKKLKLFWVWSGRESRLFHRYIAAQWAGKLKVKPKYYGFRYEVIKQDREPREFLAILNEIKDDNPEFKFPGQSRGSAEGNNLALDDNINNAQRESIYKYQQSQISDLDKKKIRKLVKEIKEIQQHVKYSINHIEKRIREIENVIGK